MRDPSALKRTSMAIPVQLREWLDREALATGRSRNSLVTYLLEKARDTQVIERLERIEWVLQIERPLSAPCRKP